MKITKPKEMTRFELQQRIAQKDKELLLDLKSEGVDIHSPEFIRRFPRAKIHGAAQVVLAHGGGPEDYLYMVKAAWVKEQGPGFEEVAAPPIPVDKVHN